ncbi:hypothetical protein BC938DRAFT_473974, partial [Jimgerdemannia flammicorona]
HCCDVNPNWWLRFWRFFSLTPLSPQVFFFKFAKLPKHDAYPCYAGVRILGQIWTQDLDVWRNLLDKMIIVDKDELPPIMPDLVKKIESINPVNTKNHYRAGSLLEKWCYLLTQDLNNDNITISDVLSYGYIIYGYNTSPETEPKCNLFIEWIYIVDLDTDSFRVTSDDGSIEFRIEELPLSMCKHHVLPGFVQNCNYCKFSTPVISEVIYKGMLDMVVAMRVVVWRHNDDSSFPAEIWLEILKRFGECCGLHYGDAVNILKMTESSRSNHKQCLRYAIIFHSRWLQMKGVKDTR